MSEDLDLLHQLLEVDDQKFLAEYLNDLGSDVWNREKINRWVKGKSTQKFSHQEFEALKQLIPSEPSSNQKEFTFVDLFAGIGGIRKGFEDLGGKCVFTSEIDEQALRTYKANFFNDRSTHYFNKDIRDVTLSNKNVSEKRAYEHINNTIPDHDVLLAGFPCQPFSIAGVSKKNSLGRVHGFECNTQGTLFFDVARIIKAKLPKAFLLENVKNLVGHDKGRTFEIIKQTLQEELGYRIYPKIIDANGFVPQHRERIYIAGFREESGFTWDAFASPEKNSVTMSNILHGMGTPEDPLDMNLKNYLDAETKKAQGKYVLSDKLWKYLFDYAARHKAKGNGFGYGMVTSKSIARTLSARYYKDGSEILVNRGRWNPRRLTPRECARLMGYPDDFRIPVSDTQAYKQFGNSVVVPVVAEIARIMKPHILSLKTEEDEKAHQYALIA